MRCESESEWHDGAAATTVATAATTLRSGYRKDTQKREEVHNKKKTAEKEPNFIRLFISHFTN